MEDSVAISYINTLLCIQTFTVLCSQSPDPKLNKLFSLAREHLPPFDLHVQNIFLCIQTSKNEYKTFGL